MEGLHICQRGVADVIHYHVKQNADTTLVRLLDQRAQILLAAHIGIEPGPVQRVVSVIGIMREVALGAAANPAVDLLQRRTDPQRIDAKLLQIIQFVRQASQIAAVEGADLLHAVAAASVAVVVGRVAVLKAIGKGKIHRGVVPIEGRRFFAIGRFQQQQSTATDGGLQGDFALADLCRLA
ncbi:hypothetical protein D3C78_964620 [compost metagenome]